MSTAAAIKPNGSSEPASFCSCTARAALPHRPRGRLTRPPARPPPADKPVAVPPNMELMIKACVEGDVEGARRVWRPATRAAALAFGRDETCASSDR